MFKPDKVHIRHCVRLCFDEGKTAAEARRIVCSTYGEGTVSASTCQTWYQRFRSGDFDFGDQKSSSCTNGSRSDFDNNNRNRTNHTKKHDSQLEALLVKNVSMTVEELAKALRVSQSAVSHRLSAIGMIERCGKLMPRELDESSVLSRLSFCLASSTREHAESFLWRLIVGGEKWITFDQSNRRKTSYKQSKRVHIRTRTQSS
ncbi:hypothetical protein M514_03093, partial [Trichuris suis]|uniref:Mos1 transposase HTH domain-containing protein n=1 Tax=Trichuris suis TaxID=68888 RepID=A0A085MFH3_9BILA